MKCFFALVIGSLIIASCAQDEVVFVNCDATNSFDLIDTVNVSKAPVLPYQLTLNQPNFIEVKIDGVLQTFDNRGTEAATDANRCFNRGNGPYCFLSLSNLETEIYARIDLGSLELDSLQAPLIIDASSDFRGTFSTRYIDDSFDTLRVESNTANGLKLVIDRYDGQAIVGTFSGMANRTMNSTSVGEVEITQGTFYVDLPKNNFDRGDRFLNSTIDIDTAYLQPSSLVEIQDVIVSIVSADNNRNVFFYQFESRDNHAFRKTTLVFEIPDDLNSFLIGGDGLIDFQTFLFSESNVYSFNQFEPLNEGTISGYLCDGDWYLDIDLEIELLHENIDLVNYKIIDELVISVEPE